MVSRFGLSDRLGAQVITETQLASSQVGPSTRDAIDAEVAGLLSASLERTRALLTLHADQHRRLAEALLHYETLNRDDVDAVLEGRLKTPTSQLPAASPSNTDNGPRAMDPGDHDLGGSLKGPRRRMQPAPASFPKPTAATAATVAGSSGVSPTLA
ncbi:unnamed protein product [Protopolystoma xenopodis]|uniref:Peptidase M41 domain-containing protein n=1 Tax=Protopolystoma xenopodis TaxID=117903 RepID=A0A448WYU0_9PLAT|nr:unnamed protein product [Protopolystoma xenopodis]